MINKSTYQLFRSILYERPRISSYPALVLFNRTLTQATYLGSQRSSEQLSNQTRSLSIRIDHGSGHAHHNDALPAVLLSRMLHSIERRCPDINIYLDLIRGRCLTNPVMNFAQESFPRLKRLQLYVGNHDPEETHQRNLDECGVNPYYWSPFFDGVTFPQLTALHVRHFWAVCPQSSASLDLEDHCKWSNSHGGFIYGNGLGGRRGHNKPNLAPHRQPAIGSLEGLEKLESLKLEYVPELDASILTRILGNPRSSAANLTTLELRFCNLEEAMLERLIIHAPPKLVRVVLLCRRPDQLISSTWEHVHSRRPEVHLCPLIRRFAKNLVHVEFGATRVCKQLILEETEIANLRQEGIIEGPEKLERRLDASAIEQSVRTCRTKARIVAREARINRSILNDGICGDARHNDKMAIGKETQRICTEQHATTMRWEIERELDAEEEERNRMIKDSNTPWFRRYVSWEGSCSGSDRFEELQIAADMEEKGIVWVLAGRYLCPLTHGGSLTI